MLMFLMLDTRAFTMEMVMIMILSLEWFSWCHYTKLDEGSNDTDFVQIVMKIFNWTFEVPTSHLWNDHVIPHSGSARCLNRSSCHKYQLSDSSWLCTLSQFASFETQLSRWKKWEYKERQLAQLWCFWKHFWQKVQPCSVTFWWQLWTGSVVLIVRYTSLRFIWFAS